MEIKRNLRKVAELGIGLTAIATLILTGCGGGSIASGSSAATISAKLVPFKGAFSAGAVVLKDKDGNPVTLLNGSGNINASGVASATFNSNVNYPLIVEVTGTYFNEVTGASEVSATPVRSLIIDAAAASATAGVPVTAITEIAVASLQNKLGGFSAAKPITAASAVAEIDGAASIIGKTHTTMLPPVFDATTNKTSDADTLKLAALAVVANNKGVGAKLADKLKDLANTFAINPTSAPTAIITQTEIDAALTNVTAGASSVAATGATKPLFVLPATSITAAASAAAASTTAAVTGSAR